MRIENIYIETAETEKYLIDNACLFIPSMNLLINCSTHSEVLLKKQASSCLLYLIRNHNNLVTQKELLEFAWEDDHKNISFNIFYQYILSIRKALIEAGLQNKIITTVPRKGLVIYNNIDIALVQGGFNVNDVAVRSISNESNKETFILKTARLYLSVAKKSLTYGSLNGFFTLLIMSAFVVVLIIIGMQNEQPYFVDYKKHTDKHYDCNLFFNADTSDVTKQILFINKHPEYCPLNKYVYLTAYKERMSISLLVCSEKIDTSIRNDCFSVYYTAAALNE